MNTITICTTVSHFVLVPGFKIDLNYHSWFSFGLVRFCGI